MFENMKELTARAERLARAHRVPFDAAYDAWLEADTIDGAPNINVYMGDTDDVVFAVLGTEQADRVKAAIVTAENEQNWEAHDALVEAADEVYSAYLTEFEYGVK